MCQAVEHSGNLLPTVVTYDRVVHSRFLYAFRGDNRLCLPIARRVEVEDTALLMLVRRVVSRPLTMLLTRIRGVRQGPCLPNRRLNGGAILLPLTIAVRNHKNVIPVLRR